MGISIDFWWQDELLLDKFEYSHYLFAGQCMDIVGRSHMLITSGSSMAKEKVLIHLPRQQL